MRAVFLFLLCSLSLFAQDDPNLFRKSYVQCYYNNEVKTPMLIYNSINGKVVDSLYNSDSNKSWYKLTVLESEYGWFKIKDIRRLPSSRQHYDYENYWVKNHDFLVNIDSSEDAKHVYIYDLPSTKANKIHKLDDFQKVSVTEVSGNWSKVKFKVGKKEIEGWLDFKHHFANPLTSSSKSD